MKMSERDCFSIKQNLTNKNSNEKKNLRVLNVINAFLLELLMVRNSDKNLEVAQKPNCWFRVLFSLKMGLFYLKIVWKVKN